MAAMHQILFDGRHRGGETRIGVSISPSSGSSSTLASMSSLSIGGGEGLALVVPAALQMITSPTWVGQRRSNARPGR